MMRKRARVLIYRCISGITCLLAATSLGLLARVLLEIECVGNEDGLLLRLLCQRVLGDGVEGLLDVESLLGRRLEVRNVTLALAPDRATHSGTHSDKE